MSTYFSYNEAPQSASKYNNTFIPHVDTTTRDSLTTWTDYSIIYNTSLREFQIYKGGTWYPLLKEYDSNLNVRAYAFDNYSFRTPPVSSGIFTYPKLEQITKNFDEHSHNVPERDWFPKIWFKASFGTSSMVVSNTSEKYRERQTTGFTDEIFSIAYSSALQINYLKLETFVHLENSNTYNAINVKVERFNSTPWIIYHISNAYDQIDAYNTATARTNHTKNYNQLYRVVCENYYDPSIPGYTARLIVGDTITTRSATSNNYDTIKLIWNASEGEGCAFYMPINLTLGIR